MIKYALLLFLIITLTCQGDTSTEYYYQIYNDQPDRGFKFYDGKAVTFNPKALPLKYCVKTQDDLGYIISAAEWWQEQLGKEMFRYSRDQEDCDIPIYKLDSNGSTLAYTYYGPSADGHVDIDRIDYAIMQEQEIERVFRHEFGHCLGLEHDDIRESLMYAKLVEGIIQVLTLNDKYILKEVLDG